MVCAAFAALLFAAAANAQELALSDHREGRHSEDPFVAALRRLKPECSGSADWSGNVVTVTLAGEAFDDTLLAQLRELKKLSYLQLAGPNITDSTIAHVAACPALVRVELVDTRVTNVGAAKLAELKTLKSLTIQNSRIGDVGLRALAALPRLEFLSLEGTRVSAAGLASLKEHQQLKGLVLRDAVVESHAMRILLDAVEGFAMIGYLAAGDPAKWERCTTDAGLEQLAGCRFELLDLCGATRIGDAGLRSLAHMTSLRTLDLRHAKVTDAGLAHLADLTELEVLRLSHTRVTDAGLVHLKGLTKLTRLTLLNTRVTSAGLEHLQGLAEVKISAGGTEIGKKGAQAWRSRPAAKVSAYERIRRREYKQEAVPGDQYGALSALASGDVATFVKLLEEDRNLLHVRLDRFTDRNGKIHRDFTALHIAVVRDDLSTARMLIQRGASVLTTDRRERTPLMLAESPAMVHLLLEYGAVVEPKARRTDSPLFQARSAAIAQILLDRGANARRIGRDGRTALHEAILHGRRDVAELLIARGADVDAHHRYRYMPTLADTLNDAERYGGFIFDDLGLEQFDIGDHSELLDVGIDFPFGRFLRPGFTAAFRRCRRRPSPIKSTSRACCSSMVPAATTKKGVRRRWRMPSCTARLGWCGSCSTTVPSSPTITGPARSSWCKRSKSIAIRKSSGFCSTPECR